MIGSGPRAGPGRLVQVDDAPTVVAHSNPVLGKLGRAQGTVRACGWDSSDDHVISSGVKECIMCSGSL